MRRRYFILAGLFLALGLLLAVGIRFGWVNAHWAGEAQRIALLPLDSRPCNTQYPQVLGAMGGYEVILPPEAALDDFLQPAESQALWQWLEETAGDCPQVIIFTNELFNGGLIQ